MKLDAIFGEDHRSDILSEAVARMRRERHSIIMYRLKIHWQSVILLFLYFTKEAIV